MRKRKLLAGLCLVLASLLAFTGVAGAAVTKDPVPAKDDNGHDFKEANKHCIELLLQGKDVADCHKAPSPILPATDELIWSILSFAAVVFLLWKFAWPGLKKGLNDRSERIRTDLESAERAKAEAEQTQATYQAQLASAKVEGARIIEEARQTADATRASRAKALEEEIAEMRRRAASEIEAAKSQAVADLQGEVARIAIGAAEHVVGQSLDQATNQRLVEDYIAQVGATR